MPIQNNGFDRFTDTSRAQRAALQTMGAACMQVAKPACPVQTGNLRNSHRSVVSGDHVDVGVTADYGGHVHNGTSSRSANPWLRNSAEASLDSIAIAARRAYEGAL